MTQTRLGSAIEAGANVAVGLGVSFVANMLVLPLFGFDVDPMAAGGIAAVFTLISLGRSYVLRRVFNRFGIRRTQALCKVQDGELRAFDGGKMVLSVPLDQRTCARLIHEMARELR